MVVCKFWQQGNCRYGDNCRFEHSGAASASNNRFGVFGQPSGSSSVGNAPKTVDNAYKVTAAGIVKDLAEERPNWIFSAYAPGRDTPIQLFGGPQTEQSFEELRLHYYKSAAAGNVQGAINDIDNLYQQTQRQIQNAIDRPNEALQYILQAENQHPNRLDICKSTPVPNTGEFAVGRNRWGGLLPQQPPNPFGAVSTGVTGVAGTSSFGQPSAPGPKPSPFLAATTTATKPSPFGQPSFGQSSFGQPSTLGQPAFGKPSFGQPAFGQPAFGQPSNPVGGPAATTGGGSAFGQSSAMGQRPAFGAPSAFGGSTGVAGGGNMGGGIGGFSKFAQTGTSTFGQPSQLGGGAAAATPAFGQPSFGQVAKPSPFGTATGTATAPNPFGQAGNGASATASPFEQAGNSTNTATTTASPFGQTAGATASPFGQASKGTPFGQAATNSTLSPFGQANTGAPAFGKPSAPADPFTQTGTTTTVASPFGQPQAPFTAATANPFQQASSQPATASSNIFFAGGEQSSRPAMTTPASANNGTALKQPYGPNASRQHPPVESYSSLDASGRMVMFKGRPVMYERDKDGHETAGVRTANGKTVKVWFYKGPPMYNKDTQLPESAYSPEVKTQYEAFMRTGHFEGGLMPELPPKREWCLWDF